MKSMTVYEVVKVRRMGESFKREWSDWKEMNDDFDSVVEKVKEDSKTNWGNFQVAKFYYDKDKKYVAWDCGVKIYCGLVHEIF